jgi:hypothetical protein
MTFGYLVPLLNGGSSVLLGNGAGVVFTTNRLNTEVTLNYVPTSATKRGQVVQVSQEKVWPAPETC